MALLLVALPLMRLPGASCEQTRRQSSPGSSTCWPSRLGSPGWWVRVWPLAATPRTKIQTPADEDAPYKEPRLCNKQLPSPPRPPGPRRAPDAAPRPRPAAPRRPRTSLAPAPAAAAARLARRPPRAPPGTRAPPVPNKNASALAASRRISPGRKRLTGPTQQTIISSSISVALRMNQRPTNCSPPPPGKCGGIS